MAQIDKAKTNPGIHKQFMMGRFTPRQQQVLQRLSREWYLTSSGDPIRLASSDYDYFLMKPTEQIAEGFNLEREIIVVLSSYKNFEPRSLDVFDAAQNRLSDLRVESVCRVLISEDPLTERKVTDLLKTDPERPVVIPFTFDELCTNNEPYFIRNRFRSHFYSRDLFSFLSPLRKDLYFFGRNQLLQDIVNRHRAGEHTGLFGLRKSGKTSVIYAVERYLESHGGEFVSIDCESPSVHTLRWFELLKKLVSDYKAVRKSNYKIIDDGRYSEQRAADSFTEDVLSMYASQRRVPVLLLFDEIERISPRTGSSTHWRDGQDFIYFWQTLRAFYQRNQSVITYMLVGTNPGGVEDHSLARHENPLFGSIPSQYIPCFDVVQTREMVRKLGKYMGLKFEEVLYSKLVEDFGGHPFLIRQFCSKIHDAAGTTRPVTVDRALYAKVMGTFKRDAVDYMDMIVSVLRDWYPDEYDMLQMLAQGDQEEFASFARDHARFTRHLIGYGLITQSQHGYTFNIEALREYLTAIHKYERVNLSTEEKVAEISNRRNQLEKALRSALRIALRTAKGKKKAGEAVLHALSEPRREKVGTDDLDVLLSRDNSPLYFLELVSIIKREWESVQYIFEMEKGRVEFILEEINSTGRPDAHAKNVSSDEFVQLRLHFKNIERALSDWNQ